MPRKGMFIVVEGADGAGTTTQSQRLVERLQTQGQRAHWTREPSDGPVGVMIRQILKGRLVAARGRPVDAQTLAALFAADRLDHLHSEVEPLLAEGTHVVTDRYVLSSLAYQSQECDPAWVRALNERAMAPALTLFLAVRAEIALERRAAASVSLDRFEKLAFQRRVVRAYEQAIDASPEQHVERLDGELAPGAVSEAIWSRVQGLLRRRSSRARRA